MKVFLVAAACSILMAMAGCSGSDGGQPRGLFTGYVTGKSEAEVTAKSGKPDSDETSTPNTAEWTYKRKTFDSDNQNQVDAESTLIFQKDAGGKMKVTQVIFG